MMHGAMVAAIARAVKRSIGSFVEEILSFLSH
jgi:hypothetical protein